MIDLHLVLISVTDGLNCIVCSSATDVTCDDPFRGDRSTSSAFSQGGFTSCLVSDHLHSTFSIIFFIDLSENGLLDRLAIVPGKYYYS